MSLDMTYPKLTARSVIPTVVLAASCVAMGACMAGPGSGEGEERAKRHDNIESLPGEKCGGIVPRYLELTDPVQGLAQLSGIPLPTEGPGADGYFLPERHYSEGGRFASAEERPEWTVKASQIAPAAPAGSLRVVEFNVERGNKLNKLIQVMKRINADVWILNETDLYRNGSGDKDSQNLVIAREMARALGYSYFTGVEFYELRPDRRGTSGNAIVSRYPLRDGRSIDIPVLEKDGGYDWSTNQSEPRCGMRNALSAFIDAEDAAGAPVALDVVDMHLENKASTKVRREQYEAVRSALVTPGEAAIGAGDFNTISEAGSFRSYLAQQVQAQGRDRTFFDCSRGDEANTFSAALGVVSLRLDWMLVQSGSDSLIDCPVGSYEVVGNGGASDHRPIITTMKLAGSGKPPSSGDSSGNGTSTSSGSSGGPDPSGSCYGHCGDVGDAGGCYCDASCVDYGDCCPDAESECGYGSPPPAPQDASCEGRCGLSDGPCACDGACVEYGDCCDDAQYLCGV